MAVSSGFAEGVGWAAESPGSYWDQGLAEINRFELEQERYGQVRRGEVVLIYVKEPFRTDVQVKYEGGDEKNVAPVLKLNFTRNFLTGIYPYSTMTSVFAPIDPGVPGPLKLTSSIQEWCGQRFVQINRKGDSYRIQGFSYFDKVRDRTDTVRDAVLEDSLWTTIRLGPDRLPTGGFKAVPGTEYCELRFVPHRAYPAVGNLKVVEDAQLSDRPLKVYRLEYVELGRWLEITFEAEPPYALVKWEEVYKVDVNGPETVTRGVRTHQQRLAYWKMNGIEDESRRADLGLVAYAGLMTTQNEETKAMNDKQTSPNQDNMVTIYDVETGRTEAMPKVEKSDEAWQEQLSQEEYTILRHAGTERAFTGKLYKNKETGHYVCKACGTDLYLSDDKFDSGSGWPSYMRPVAESNVTYHQDVSHGMIRTEIRCARCGSHLGHVFDDGPAPTGKRHCINSACLDFVPKK